ncbi:SpoIIE family protein phosphatase [candidate division KSB1 bacterium]|nr:SpoIIE family protein phosphatase [candidate division KSB1 bacterium]
MTKSRENQSKDALFDEIKKLRRAVSELSILNDLAREIGASTNSEKIMQRVINRSLRAVNAEQGTITLVGEDSADPHKTLVRDMVSSSHHQPYHIDQALLGWMHLNKKILALSDPHHDHRFAGVHWDESVHSILCVPLLIKSKLIGILIVLNKRDGAAFDQDDERLLAIIAAQSAQVIDNARLYEEEQKYIQMQEELRLAREIQLGLLPAEIPKIPLYDIAGKSLPAHQVGGDYFDVIPVDDETVALCVGDASGHGLAAAMLMANLQAIIKSQIYSKCSPEECLQRANTILYQNTQTNCFATFFFGLLNYTTHSFVYANAGHCYPILIKSDGTATELALSGVLLSFVPDIMYESSSTKIDPGDVLAIFSDGTFESQNSEEEQYGETRLIDVLRTHRKQDAATLLAETFHSIQSFAQNRPQDDDMTLIVVKRVEVV